MPTSGTPSPFDPQKMRQEAEKLLAQLESIQAKHFSAELVEPIESLNRLLRGLPPATNLGESG